MPPRDLVMNEKTILNIEHRMKEAISLEEAEITTPGLVSFFNPRLNHKIEQKRMNALISVREDLLKSKDLFLCVNSHLIGYNEGPEKGDKTSLIKSVKAVTLLKDEPTKFEMNGIVTKFIRIKYENSIYWVRESVLNKETGVKYKFVTKFSECSKIQSLIEDYRVELTLIQNTEAKLLRSSLINYVCAKKDDKISGHLTKDLNHDVEFNNGSQVARLQGFRSKPFTHNNQTYIHIKHGKQAYWVVQDSIKAYKNCPKIHTQAVEVCTEKKLNYYESDVDLIKEAPTEQLNAFQHVYKFLGDIYSRKVILSPYGEELTYVPIKKSQDAKKVYWVLEKYVPQTCNLNSEKGRVFQGKMDYCTVRRSDNFPYFNFKTKKGAPAQFDYYTNTAMYGARRTDKPACAKEQNGAPRNRLHGGIDLFSYERNSPLANNKWGRKVYAIDDGKVVSIQGYGGMNGGTQRVLVQSKYGYTWNYAEIGRVKVKVGDFISQNTLLGTTKKYAPGKRFPPMLHLEKYLDLIEDEKTTNQYCRVSSLSNPSCHIEYMENKFFGTRR